MPHSYNSLPTTPLQVLSQPLAADGHVEVTFALPGLRRATVRVPGSVWLEGQHLGMPAQLHALLEAMLPPAVPDAGQLQLDEPDET